MAQLEYRLSVSNQLGVLHPEYEQLYDWIPDEETALQRLFNHIAYGRWEAYFSSWQTGASHPCKTFHLVVMDPEPGNGSICTITVAIDRWSEDRMDYDIFTGYQVNNETTARICTTIMSHLEAEGMVIGVPF